MASRKERIIEAIINDKPYGSKGVTKMEKALAKLSEAEAGNGNGGSGGGGGVSSWNDLTDKPFYKTSTPICGMTKQTIEIAQRVNSYGTFFGGITDGFGDIVKEVGPDTGKGHSYVTNFNAEDRIVVTVDGVEYEDTLTNNGAHGYNLGNYPLYWGDYGPSGTSSFPFCMCFGDTGFEIWMSDENVGTHEISIQIYRDECKKLDEEFIPDTILRSGVAPSIESYYPTEMPIIHAGTTTSNGYVSANMRLKDGETLGVPFVCASGEYIDVETGDRHYRTVDWDITQTAYEYSDGSLLHTYIITFSIPEAVDYDITVRVASNYPFRGAM